MSTFDPPSTVSPTAEVFISHSSSDQVAAQTLRRALIVNGYRVWMAPDDVVGGGSWIEQIVGAINRCPIMLVVVSAASIHSDHVSREVSMALDAGKAVVPVRVENVGLAGSLQYLLHLVQWVDAFPPPVERHVPQVLSGVARAQPAPRPSPLPPPTPIADKLARPPRRRTPIVITVAAALVLALVIALIVHSRSDSTAASSSTIPPSSTSAVTTTAAPETTESSTTTSVVSTTTIAPSTTVADPLLAIPTNVGALDELAPNLPLVAAFYGLPGGAELPLGPQTTATGSVVIQAPTSWADVDGKHPWVSDTNAPIGDFLLVATDESRAAAFKAGGIFIGASSTQTFVGSADVDAEFSSQQFIDLGCVASKVITVGGELGGQVRIWSGCDDAVLLVTAVLGTDAVYAHFFGIATSVPEAKALAAALTSLSVTPGKITVYPKPAA